jgi:hypothetical protein
MITLSPSRMREGDSTPENTRLPRPAVVTKIPPPLPLGTTLVSHVTIRVSASRAAAAAD